VAVTPEEINRMFINRFMKFPGLFFDANGGGGSGASEESGEEKKEETKPITFKSQEELDAQFAARAAQGKRSALEDLFKGLGVKDADELKAFFNEGKKLKEGQQTELEKAANEKKTAEEALNAEKESHTQTRTIYTERLLKSEVRSEAKKAGFREESLDDVWLLVKANYREKITEKDDMFVGVAQAIEEIKKSRAYWLGETQETKTKTPGSPKPGSKKGDGQPTQQINRPASRL
jgi:hypothetical protein